MSKLQMVVVFIMAAANAAPYGAAYGAAPGTIGLSDQQWWIITAANLGAVCVLLLWWADMRRIGRRYEKKRKALAIRHAEETAAGEEWDAEMREQLDLPPRKDRTLQ